MGDDMMWTTGESVASNEAGCRGCYLLGQSTSSLGQRSMVLSVVVKMVCCMCLTLFDINSIYTCVYTHTCMVCNMLILCALNLILYRWYPYLHLLFKTYPIQALLLLELWKTFGQSPISPFTIGCRGSIAFYLHLASFLLTWHVMTVNCTNILWRGIFPSRQHLACDC